ncbi:MAG: IS256 family transposase [Actinomycetia bacterium]|nr:IS256 family transposase [Actinomycetes bacterium]
MSKYSGKIQYVKDEQESSWSVLEQIARKGAKKMLQLALENEVEEYIQKHSNLTGEDGKRVVVKNGHMPQRDITTGMGPLTITQPRVDDRGLKKRFSSNILPRYLRRIPSVDNLVPVLYLKGISTNDFGTALESILGKGVSGLSAANIVRLKRIWEEEYDDWRKRDLSDKEYVYFWVDGIYFNVRLDDSRSAILIIMAADQHGNKELVAAQDGYRESKIAWTEILADLKRRGLKMGPKLSIGDGGLGFWAALSEIYPQSRRQRCWVHKTANILDKMPKSIQSKAKAMIHDMYMASTKEDALAAYDHFISSFSDKYPRAVECLAKDKEDLFSFYDFPATHWIHIRTTNPIESTFSTVRLRTYKTKGCGSRTATLTMVYKLALEASRTWKRLKGYKLILKVLEGKKFVDGELEEEVAA